LYDNVCYELKLGALMKLFPFEFWIVLLLAVNLCVITILFIFIRNLKNTIRDMIVGDAAEKVMDMIEPAVKETGILQSKFEDQLREKKLIISDLNRRLDDKIISLNILLKRTDEYLNRDVVKKRKEDVISSETRDQQQAVLDLFRDGFDSGYIADKLNLSESEVKLVIDLKKKFINMEKSG